MATPPTSETPPPPGTLTVFNENFGVYGVREVWRQMLRDGFEIARRAVSRLTRSMGLSGAVRGKRIRTTMPDPAAPCPRDRVFRAPAPNVGSVGDSYDNALAETVIGLFKTEVIHRRGPWRSFEAVEFATLEWVHWFNERRPLEPIGNIPPAEAEANELSPPQPMRLRVR